MITHPSLPLNIIDIMNSKLYLPLFPAEVLQGVTSHVSGVDLISLWCSGDRLLRQKLGPGGGVSSVQLIDETQSSSNWPKLLGELRGLRHLVVKRGLWPLFRKSVRPITNDEWEIAVLLMKLSLKTLSTELETCIVECMEMRFRSWPEGELAHDVLLNFFDTCPQLTCVSVPSTLLAKATNLTSLKRIKSIRIYPSVPLPGLHLPPALESITWDSRGPPQPPPGGLNRTVGLKSLCLPFLAGSEFSELPRGITSLKLTHSIVYPDGVQWPTSLVHLELCMHHNFFYQNNLDFEALSQLQSLQLRPVRPHHIVVSAQDLHLPLQNRHLTKLVLGFEIANVLILPASVTALEVRPAYNTAITTHGSGNYHRLLGLYSNKDSGLLEKLFSDLPPFLQSLSITHTQYDSIKTPTYDDSRASLRRMDKNQLRHLEKLHLSLPLTLTAALLSSPLCQRVRDLTWIIQHPSEWHNIMARHIPPSVTSFNLQTGGLPIDISDDTLAFLPVTLRHLTLPDHSIAYRLTKYGVATLSKFTQLSTLRLSNWISEEDSDDFFAALPPSLTLLHLRGSVHLPLTALHKLPASIKQFTATNSNFELATTTLLYPQRIRIPFFKQAPPVWLYEIPPSFQGRHALSRHTDQFHAF